MVNDCITSKLVHYLEVYPIFPSTVDDQPPVVVCPHDIEITIRTGEGGATITYTEPVVTDDSGTANRISASHQPGDFFPLGRHTVTYRYSDNSGNIGSCSFEVLVSDGMFCALVTFFYTI